jgi:hypothetical protein
MTALGFRPGRMTVMDDDDEIILDTSGDFSDDPVAARAEAYTRLLRQVAELADDELRKEATMMLKAIRTSFKTLPTGELRSIGGDKE